VLFLWYIVLLPLEVLSLPVSAKLLNYLVPSASAHLYVVSPNAPLTLIATLIVLPTGLPLTLLTIICSCYNKCHNL